MRNTIHYVTSNHGKFAEVKHYIETYAPEMDIQQAAIDIPEIQSLDQIAVALDKAKKAYDLIQQPLLLDDGGIFLEAYHQFPGTLSKFVFQGIGFEGMFKLAETARRPCWCKCPPHRTARKCSASSPNKTSSASSNEHIHHLLSFRPGPGHRMRRKW